MSGENDKTKNPAMHAVYSAAVGGVAGGLLYGMNENISLPGGFAVRAPIGMAIHVGLASYLTDAFVCPNIDPMLSGMPQIQKYSCDLSAAAVTPALLTLAGDQTVGVLPGALIGGLSHLAADMLDTSSKTANGVHSAAVYGGARMYSSGQGYQYGSCGGGCGGCGQTASKYGQRY